MVTEGTEKNQAEVFLFEQYGGHLESIYASLADACGGKLVTAIRIVRIDELSDV